MRRYAGAFKLLGLRTWASESGVRGCCRLYGWRKEEALKDIGLSQSRKRSESVGRDGQRCWREENRAGRKEYYGRA